MLPTLIESLRDPACYPHPVAKVEVIETHISWILLTGEYAYKVKKPVNFGFLDFTTLAQRRHCCEEEVRLNQRLAPDIYIGLVPISGTPEAPHLDAEGEPIEYAVKMYQFDPELRLDRLLQRQLFEVHWIDLLAEQIADFHQRLPIVAQDSPWGEPDTLWEVVADNYRHIPPDHLDTDDWSLLQQLSAQTAETFRSLEGLMRQRKRQGHVRECHGDLHLANVNLFHDQLRLFDCIEFNLEFRWIDTISDLAFLLMDLEANRQFRWANRLLNLYLERTGDYDALPLLNFFKAYRSMVRAKVAMLGEHPDIEGCRHYLKLTEHYYQDRSPAVFLMHGVSGSGKSYLSERLAEAVGVIRIRSDVERKRIYRELSLQGQSLELYGAEMNSRTFQHLYDTTVLMLKAGYSVVVDATFIQQRTRNAYVELAQQLNLPMRIISCHCEQNLIEARLKRRQEEGLDPSDANVEVMREQLNVMQPLSSDEQLITLPVDTRDDEAIEQLMAQLRAQRLIGE
ncbi:AAA family ATPase [Marinobacterium sp. AK62]|uniref:AAA family ATPase n=1 Tax=Marinobacterium alkalitolerans TaxID=1542925 RepID=A0ABS3ZDF8_9GAMM|nr:bifunctional aminoglycoside phosphotransferase/ATP-binding protein [Marinobacterium alkalitolerans]MBP0049745.1 AAA family ATPase [Marinobacterium alkalitolerans]